MVPVLVSLSSDLVDLATFFPEEDDCFHIDLLLRIGIDNGGAADNFTLRVCTAKWIDKMCFDTQFIRHMLMVRRYNLSDIKEEIITCIERCYGSDWNEVSLKLSRYFEWEFEDYVSLSPAGL